MNKPTKAVTRVLAVLLAAIMLIGVLPVSAMGIDAPITGTTGSGWEEFGGEFVDSGDIIVTDNENGSDAGSSPTYDDEDDTNLEDDSNGGVDVIDEEDADSDGALDAEDLATADDSDVITSNAPASSTPADTATSDTSAGSVASPTDAPALGESGDSFVLPDDVGAEFLAFVNAVKLQINRNARLRSAPGDTGMVTWTWGDSVNFTTSATYYVVSMPEISFTSANDSEGTPFCALFGEDPSIGGTYTATAGSDDSILRLLVSYEEGNATAAGTQMAIWSITNHASFAEYGPAAAALSAAAGVDTTGYSYLLWDIPGAYQPFFTLESGDDQPSGITLKIIKKNEDGSAVLSNATFSVTGPNGFSQTGLKTNSSGEILIGELTAGTYTVTETAPPAGYEAANPASKTVNVTAAHNSLNPAVVEFRNIKKPTTPGGGGGDTETIVETEEETTTEVLNTKEYSYSDAIGQITIRKHDQDQNSLDGALFNIRVGFTNGDEIIVTDWEVDNGARLFTYTHPQDNHDPATISVKEVQAPNHYDLDPTPQTAVVSPTYTRVTHVETWSVTTTTTTTNVTVVKDGETIDENSSTATAEVTSDPQVEEFTDFIAGDRDITVTFTNSRQTGDIIVTKRDANTGLPLAGASVHLWGQDLGNPQHVDQIIVTDTNGEAKFEFLPPGTYAIQETQAPYGYNLNNAIQTAVLQSNQILRTEIHNYRMDGLFIKKVDENGKPLAGATFELRRGSGEVLLSDVTNENGVIFRGYLTDDTYEIEEIKAPEGYLMDENPIQSIRIYATDPNKEYTVTFVNKKKPAIEITKVDGLDSGVKLAGAVFRITNTLTNQYWDVETGEDGKALLEDLEINATYMVEETNAPEGYVSSGYRQEIVLKESRVHTLTVENFENPGIQIIKKDRITGKPLAGATFRISWNDGSDYRDVTTGFDGKALVTGLKVGWYSVVETKAPEGYTLDATPTQVLLEGGKTAVVELFNDAKPSLEILKVDDVTKTPLQYAKFKIELKTQGANILIGEYVSDVNGLIRLFDIQPGRYLITEVQAPDGYNVDETTCEVTIESGEAYQLEFTNTPKSPIYIQKVDDKGNALMGAKFKVTTMNGAMIGTVTTGLTGYAIIPYSEPGWYVVEEVQAPDGYILSNTPVNVEVLSGQPAQVQFVNFAKPGLRILKLDADTREPLAGAKFKVAKASGESVGEYTTDITGLIQIEDLPAGAYVISEIRAPEGYILDVSPYTVNLEPGKTLAVEVYNTAKPGLQVVKKDVLTGLPVAGARFDVTFIENGTNKDMGSFTTGENGVFFVANLAPGYYIVTETRAADGYILDSTPREVYVEGGKMNTLEVFNTPYSDLRLLKIDAETRDPLAGATFRLFDEKRLEIGTYTSSALGEIYISGIPSGKYFIQEIKAPAGYVLDNTVRQVELLGGKTTTVEVKNTPLGTLRVHKVDTDTGKPLYGATFLLYDSKDNLLGEYTTNQNGLIVFGTSLQAGTYKLKETKAPENYVLDETIHTISVKAGSTVEYTVKNKLQVGKIQIIKVSDGANPITGDKKGDELKDAIFEIYDEDLNLVDKIRTDSNGLATSDELPLGKYVIKEVAAPKYYFTDGKPFYAEIKVHEDLIRFKIENTPEIIEVDVTKRGVAETMPGEVIRYTFSDIANLSNCELDDFYWRDTLPTDAVRLLSINTGTWSDRGTYEVWVKTNLKDWKRVKSNLHTNTEYTVNMADIGLASNEFVTEFKLEFGKVPEGFTAEKDPFIEVRVNNSLPGGYRFTNNTDVGGRRGREWVYDRDSWTTVIYRPYGPDGKYDGSPRKLPQTGGPDFFTQYPEYLPYRND